MSKKINLLLTKRKILLSTAALFTAALISSEANAKEGSYIDFNTLHTDVSADNLNDDKFSGGLAYGYAFKLSNKFSLAPEVFANILNVDVISNYTITTSTTSSPIIGSYNLSNLINIPDFGTGNAINLTNNGVTTLLSNPGSGGIATNTVNGITSFTNNTTGVPITPTLTINGVTQDISIFQESTPASTSVSRNSTYEINYNYGIKARLFFNASNKVDLSIGSGIANTGVEIKISNLPTEDDVISSFTYDIGLNYALSDNIDILARYEAYAFDDFENIDTEVEIIKLGISYKF